MDSYSNRDQVVYAEEPGPSRCRVNIRKVVGYFFGPIVRNIGSIIVLANLKGAETQTHIYTVHSVLLSLILTAQSTSYGTHSVILCDSVSCCLCNGVPGPDFIRFELRYVLHQPLQIFAQIQCLAIRYRRRGRYSEEM